MACAILFASAVATSSLGFLSNILAIHDPGRILLQPNQFNRVIASVMSNLRISDYPAFDIRPSLILPPEEYCRGTKPSHPAKLGPHLNVSIGGASVSIASAVIGPRPGIVCKRRASSDWPERSFADLVLALIRNVFSATRSIRSRHSSRINGEKHSRDPAKLPLSVRR